MRTNFFLLFTLSVSLFFASCKKEFTIENETVSGPMTLTQKSFTPLTFDSMGKPTTAKIVQEFKGTLSTIGSLTADLNVNFDLTTGKSGEVIASYIDKDGDKINTTSSSVGDPKGITITEKITGGTGKFAAITGGGTYYVNLDFVSGNGNGTIQWTVTF